MSAKTTIASTTSLTTLRNRQRGPQPTQAPSVPRVSVIMPVYDESDHILAEAIRSVLTQTLRDLELIIVLDKPDNARARTLIRSFAHADYRVVALFNKKNSGRGASRNRAIKTSRGRYIAILDADDIAVPTRLAKQTRYLAKHPEVDLLFGWARLIDRGGKDVGALSPPRHRFKNIRKHFFGERLLIHPTMMVRGELLRALHYDPSFVRSQDYEFWMRCLARGAVFAVLPEPLVQYRVPLRDDGFARMDRQMLYSKYTLKAFRKHWRSFWTNPYFILSCIRHTGYFLVATVTPRFLVTPLLKLKDFLSQ